MKARGVTDTEAFLVETDQWFGSTVTNELDAIYMGACESDTTALGPLNHEARNCWREAGTSTAAFGWAARKQESDCLSFAARLALICDGLANLRHRRAGLSTTQSKPGARVVHETAQYRHYAKYDMNAMWVCGAISGVSPQELKYDQSKLELEGMFQKHCISKWDFQLLLGDLTLCKCTDELMSQYKNGVVSARYCRHLKNALNKFELEGSLKKGSKAVDAFQTPQVDTTQHKHSEELTAMQNTEAVSAEYFRQVKYDLIKFGLEGILKKGVIPEIDFESLEGFVTHCPCIHDSKIMQPSGTITDEDFMHLKRLYDLVKFGLEGMLNKGAISDVDVHTIEVHSAHGRRIQDLKTRRENGTISAEEFEDLKCDLIKFEVESILEEATSSNHSSKDLQHDSIQSIDPLLQGTLFGA